MTHFVRCDSNGLSFFAGVEERSAFGFSDRGQDIAYDGGSDEKGAAVFFDGVGVDVSYVK